MNNEQQTTTTRRSLEVRDKTWARVKYQATMKHKKVWEVVDDLLCESLVVWENRGKL